MIGDAPTQSLIDPDHPLAREAVGTQGVSLCRKQDFLDLFKDVPLDEVSISSSVPAFFTLAGLVLAARETGVPLNRLRGSILHGPLYTEDCSYAWHLPVEFRVRLALDSIEFCSRHMPKFHAYLEDTYFFSEVRPNAGGRNGSGLRAIETSGAQAALPAALPSTCLLPESPFWSIAAWISSKRSPRFSRHAPPLRENDARRIRRVESALAYRPRSPATPPVFR